MKKGKQEPKKEPKYFWFKLHDDFFADSKIKLLEKMPNGEKYGWFLFKLICKSIKTDGLLRFSDKLPYSPKMLADITDTDIDVVRSALSAFDTCELIDIFEDGTYFIDLVPNNTGKESESAERVRKCRDRKKALLEANVKALQCDENVTSSRYNNNIITLQCNDKSLHYNGEKDLEIKKDIEYNNSAHTCEEKPVENSFDTNLKYRAVSVKGGSAYLFISDAQLADLSTKYDEETLGYYFRKINELGANGYKHGCSDYEYIIRLIEEDRKVRKNE